MKTCFNDQKDNIYKSRAGGKALRLFLTSFVFIFLGGYLTQAFGNSTTEPPKVSVVDKNYVNLIGGKPNISLTTIQFGPPNMGLSHVIANYDGYFHGYADNFMGSVGTAFLVTNPSTGAGKTVMRVISGHKTTDFDIVGDEFLSLSTPQFTLKKYTTGYLFTDPEGTEYRYEYRENATLPRLVSITYANGYAISVHLGENSGGVTTNTGLQFKYLFEGTSAFERSFPAKIQAINNAVEFCAPDRSPCDLDHEWPRVQYQWPKGMPQVMYRTSSIFRVVDPAGRVAEYIHKPFDTYEGADPNSRGVTFIPRIVEMQDGISQEATRRISYDYENVVGWANGAPSLTNVSFVHKTTLEPAVLIAAKSDEASWSYSISNQNFRDQWGSKISKWSSGYQAIKKVEVATARSVPTHVTTHDREITLQDSLSNEVLSVSFPEGNKINYRYDERGRLTRITEAPKAGSSLPNSITTLEYPSGCPNPKTCNKPLWIEDAKGNRTDYTYHAQSGQVKTITEPTVSVGSSEVRPKTSYNYSQLYAYYKKHSNTVERADQPIWMLTSEFTCRTTPATKDGCTGGDLDKIETRYYYGPQDGSPNNLFLRGISVTAAGDTGVLQARVTCFEYDRYGNQVAKTSPKGTTSLTSCP